MGVLGVPKCSWLSPSVPAQVFPLLQKALLQAREQFEHSSGKQKDLYEQKLADMEGRLQEAMARKERAKSMAKKPKRDMFISFQTLVVSAKTFTKLV